jgi:hypothetical protein
MVAVGVIADAAQLVELRPDDHIIRHDGHRWVCVRPAHTGLPCTQCGPGPGQSPGATMPAERVPVRVLLTVGDQAELVTPDHTPQAPLRVPSAVIAQDAGLPANELPGREFTAVRDGNALRDFQLVNDPRL